MSWYWKAVRIKRSSIPIQFSSPVGEAFECTYGTLRTAISNKFGINLPFFSCPISSSLGQNARRLCVRPNVPAIGYRIVFTSWNKSNREERGKATMLSVFPVIVSIPHPVTHPIISPSHFLAPFSNPAFVLSFP